jgi:hypothetical protein
MHQQNAAILDLLSSAPQSAVDLCRRLGISQPTLSRRMAELGDAVLRFGPQKSVRYARRRLIRHWNQFALSRVTREGQLQEWGRLHSIAPQGFILSYAQEGRANERHDGLPWWMQDMRPQGFLGRGFAKAVAAQLDVSNDPRMWSDDHVLLALAESGEDMVGNLLIGDNARQRWLTAPLAAPLQQEHLAASYRELARRALAGEDTGSSAGGEQPKFAAYVDAPDDAGGAYHALVKFTVPENNAASQRWRNLLACEHIALASLSEAGLPASRSRLFDSEGQRFLEVQRFDREGELGRRGVVSLLAMDAEFVGHGTEWPQITRELLAKGHVTQAAHDTACRLHVFGQLIGNGDMHAGNLSFLHDGTRPLSIAPAYDMLPMSLSPRTSGVIPEAAQMNRLVVPSYPETRIWNDVLPLAETYWRRVERSDLIDDGFRLEVRAMQERLESVRGQLARLASN